MSLNPHDVPPPPAPSPRKGSSCLHCSDGEVEAKSGQTTCSRCLLEHCLGHHINTGCSLCHPQPWARLPVARGRPIHQLHTDLPRQLSLRRAARGRYAHGAPLTLQPGAHFGLTRSAVGALPWGPGGSLRGDCWLPCSPRFFSIKSWKDLSAVLEGTCFRNDSTFGAKASRNLGHTTRGQSRA